MRTQSKIDALLAEYELMCRQDWDELFSHADPDFEFIPPDRGLGASVTRGREKARDDIKTFFSPYEEVIIEPNEFHERGDRIAVFFELRCRPHGSTAMVEIRAGHVWTVREGRLASLQVFAERREALEAAEAAHAADLDV